ncbi:MAG: DUF1515 family protein [Burkholderiaceae bacterium]|nr:DUF1515 family protein [Burkholderiaceae bacterium]
MAGDLNDIYEVLGSLKAEVKNLRQDISQVNVKIEKRLESLEPKLAELSHRTEKVELGIASVKKDVGEDVMPVIDEVKAWKQRGIGALAMAGMGGGALGVAITSWWDSLLSHFR